MPDRRRLQRLENAILHAVAPLISHGLADPRLNLVTVTRIRLSADLTVARVNWSCLGDRAARSMAAKALEDARGVLQGTVGKSLHTRVTPRLEFHYDESLERAVRVNTILEDLARERREREGDPEEDAEASED